MQWIYGQTNNQSNDWQVEATYNNKNPLIRKMQTEQEIERGASPWVRKNTSENSTK
jgi:hypothetical protein